MITADKHKEVLSALFKTKAQSLREIYNRVNMAKKSHVSACLSDLKKADKVRKMFGGWVKL